MPMRSQTKKPQTATILAQKIRRRHSARLRRCQATQLTKKRMWRPSSCMTGSELSTKEGGWEKCRTFRQREQAERKEAVDALAVTGDHKGPLRIARPEIFGFRRQADAVGLDEIGQHLLVASFLKAVDV